MEIVLLDNAMFDAQAGVYHISTNRHRKKNRRLDDD